MDILSFEFLVFGLVVLLVYYFLPCKAQNIWLLLASYVFYYQWSTKFFVVLILATLFNYLLARAIQGREGRSRKALLWFGLVADASAFIAFRLDGGIIVGRALAVLFNPANAALFELLLPVGFSYYILQAISYLIDVYREQTPAAENLVDFALYMAYFPKLVSGPIERAKTFLPILAAPRSVDNQQLARALGLILVGLIRKLLIADKLRGLIPAMLFADAGSYARVELVFYILVYSIWLYNDFAGYTSIVRGISTFFGIELSRNFQQPYLSRNFSEFWNRWHISLSHWLRDYIYYPVSRSLRRRFRKQRLLNAVIPAFAPMLISGMWHDVGFYMLAWGGLHGLYQAYEQVKNLYRPSPPPNQQPCWRQWLNRGLVFLLALAAWVPFGSGGLMKALGFYRALLTSDVSPVLPFFPIVLGAGIAILASFVIDLIQYRNEDELAFYKWPRAVQVVLLAAVLMIFFLNFALGAKLVAEFVYQGF